MNNNKSNTISSTIPNTIGGRIRTLREKKNIKLTVMSGLIGVDRATLCRWEHDDREPSLSDIRKLADFFDVSASYIAFGAQHNAKYEVLDMAGLPYSKMNLVRQIVEALRGD